MIFLKVCIPFFFIPAILGLVAGVLYSKGIIGDTGLWVDALNITAEFFMDKRGFVFESLGALYVVGWAALSGLNKAYHWSKWILIKCFLGLTVVPVFAIFAGIYIPAFYEMRALTANVTIMGYVLAWAWYFYLA